MGVSEKGNSTWSFGCCGETSLLPVLVPSSSYPDVDHSYCHISISVGQKSPCPDSWTMSLCNLWGSKMPGEISVASRETNWAAANGGVKNGGLRGVWLPFLEIDRNRPFSPFFCLFCPFPEGAKSTWEIQKTEEKGPFPQISSDLLQPPSLKPPFAAPQTKHEKSSNFRGKFRVFFGCNLQAETKNQIICVLQLFCPC